MKPDTSFIDSLLEKAIKIAVNAHFGQTDKSGKPYILHPLRLMEQACTTTEKICAILHDVLEDTAVKVSDLREQGFTHDIIDALVALTKQDKEAYQQFIERIAQNPISVKVKLIDLYDNTRVSRLSELKEKDVDRLRKYIEAIKYLENLNLSSQ